MRKILAIAKLSIKLAYGPTFFIFMAIGSLFVVSSILYFFLPELAQFGSRDPGQNMAAAGLSSLNLFLIFLSIFLSLSVLTRQFRKDNLIFLLSKPVQSSQLLIGTALGLVIVFLSFWALLSLELLVIIALLAKHLLLQTLFALLPVVLLMLLYTSLTVFFFSLWPSSLSAILPFLFIITSFTQDDVFLLLSAGNIVWLKRLMQLAFFFIPPVGKVMAISFRQISLFDVEINLATTLAHAIFIAIFLLALGSLKVSRSFSKL